jgi:hypothetical protein
MAIRSLQNPLYSLGTSQMPCFQRFARAGAAEADAALMNGHHAVDTYPVVCPPAAEADAALMNGHCPAY